MAALSGEPWRGNAVVRLTSTLNQFRTYRLSIDTRVVGTGGDGDCTTWEGNPSASFTLRLEWGTGTTPPAAPAAADGNALVRVFLPSGAQVGSDWTPAVSGDSGVATTTIHFDDNPLNAVAGAARSGTLELYLQVQRTALVAWGPLDSRGAGTAPALTTVDWARGYLRSRFIVSSSSISNVAIAGAEPASWAAADPVHTRIAMSAASYRAYQPVLSLRRPSNGTAERQETDGSLVDANRDFSWTTTTAGLTAVIGASMQPSTSGAASTESKDIRLDLPTLDFGGDNEYAYAATGHQSGWVVDSAQSIRYPARIAVDPRIYPTSGDLTDWAADRGALFHNQNGGSAFFDPPSIGDIDNGQRVFPDVGFVGVRLLNARGEGLNGLTTTIKMWDAASIGSSEGSPAHTLSRVTETKRDSNPQTTPEAGWLPQEQTGVNDNKLPLTWSTVLAGTWRVKSVVTAPTALVGIENYPLVSGGAFWNRNLFLITSNPNYSAPIISIHPHDISHHGTHLTRTDELILFVYMLDNTTKKFVELIEANGDKVEVEVTREHHPTGRVDYFNFATETWVEKTNGGALVEPNVLIRASDSPAHPGGDPDAWTNYPPYVGDIFVPDGAAGELDFTIIATLTKDGVPYSQTMPVAFVGESNKHNSPPYGMKIGPFFDRK